MMPLVRTSLLSPLANALAELPADKVEHLTLLTAGLILFRHAKGDQGCNDAYFASIEAAEIVLGMIGVEARLVVSPSEMRINPALFVPRPRRDEEEPVWTAYEASLATMSIQFGLLNLRA